jgi:hypothetical protein
LYRCETRCLNLCGRNSAEESRRWRKLPNEQLRVLFCARCYWCEGVEWVILLRTEGKTDLCMKMLSRTLTQTVSEDLRMLGLVDNVKLDVIACV